MKTSFSYSALIFLFFFVNSSLVAQENSPGDNEILICAKPRVQITLDKLNICNTLSVSDENMEVISFVVSFSHDNYLIEEKVKGNEFTEGVLLSISEKKPPVIYIEMVTLADGRTLDAKKLEMIYQ